MDHIKRRELREQRIRVLLDRMAHRLVEDLLDKRDDVYEGRVMTVGPPAYRRLDCGARALAYLRSRPRRAALRVEISGLWLIPRVSPLMVKSATGATLMVSEYAHLEEAVAFLSEVVDCTRAADEGDQSVVDGSRSVA